MAYSDPERGRRYARAYLRIPENKKRHRQCNKKWRKEHPEIIRAQCKRRYLRIRSDPERWAKVLERNRKYRRTYGEDEIKKKLRHARYYARHKTEILERSRNYFRSHREKVRRYRAAHYWLGPGLINEMTKDTVDLFIKLRREAQKHGKTIEY